MGAINLEIGRANPFTGPPLIVLMSPSGYPSARLLPSSEWPDRGLVKTGRNMGGGPSKLIDIIRLMSGGKLKAEGSLVLL